MGRNSVRLPREPCHGKPAPLLANEADLSLAGGVPICLYQKTIYLHLPFLLPSAVLGPDLVHIHHMFHYQDVYVTEMLLNLSLTVLHDLVYVLHFLVYSKTIKHKHYCTL